MKTVIVIKAARPRTAREYIAEAESLARERVERDKQLWLSSLQAPVGSYTSYLAAALAAALYAMEQAHARV